MEIFKILGTIALSGQDKFNDDIDSASGKGKKLSDVLGKGLAVAAKVGFAAVSAAAAGVVKLTKSAVENYAEYEQFVGGVETLFKDSAGTVMQYAENAYKTAGLSANDYMDTVTSFSASLLQSLGGDTAAAADMADMAITDMSDNANKMGTDMTSIQNAYQGFAKQNYTMLDNLKLGYGGTKEEMQRLIDDANALNAAQGKATDYSIDSFADIVSAIHDVQTEMGITGTTAKEASSTIQGSVNSAKAAWENWLTALGDSNADVQQKTDELMSAIGTAAQNILPVVEQVLSSIGRALATKLPELLSQAVSFVISNLPQILGLGLQLIVALADGLNQGFNSLLTKMGEWIQANLISPAEAKIAEFINVGARVVDNIKEGIANAWNGLVSWFENLWNSLFNRHATISVDQNGATASPRASGLDYVPYNNFPAMLHEGEAVLTASEADAWRKGNGGGSGKGVTIIQNITAVAQTPVQLASATAAYFEQARWAL